MTERILVAQPLYDAGLARVRRLAPDAVVEVVEPFGPSTVLPEALVRDVTVLFSDLCPANVAAMPRLRWVQLGSHGYSQLNGLTLPPGTTVANASGVNDIPIAEWCVMMMLAFGRDLPGMLAAQREHRWDRDARFQAELRGRRVGLFGYGNIGRELARLCRALGLEVWTLSRFRPGARELRYDPLDRPAGSVPVPDRTFAAEQRDEFLAGLDYLVVTTPVTSATRGWVDAAALRGLQPHAVLLNPARAGVVDEAALLAALRDGTIAGAALDDHYRQPMPPDDPFFELPNVIVTSHISGSSSSTWFVERIWDLFTRNLERYLAGDPLLNVIARDDLELAP
ncbi:D-2-hydroxyacid dehydrogenase [Jiangella aurantiaca]|uniref:D-2-hydroxyacid dehydrogenase n=1 Tax=Jiangella aurantiaca TaxID=2530373 RepID=A0A4R5ABA6_9ACTN|nr:D-2-hydroxyacid dehydrogenase [Jiangella aurantiaca]TDD68955.1 D-2-hydroxyacid dehydrogenase [Jiangella aurantiaca]